MRKELDYSDFFNRFAKDGDVLDDVWISEMDETLNMESELVGRKEWDSGNPGAGAGVVDVSKFRGHFYTFDDASICGPYESFMEAAEASGLFAVSSATTNIWADPFAATETLEERTAVQKAANEADRLLEAKRSSD